jgi:hypothetical protein
LSAGSSATVATRWTAAAAPARLAVDL